MISSMLMFGGIVLGATVYAALGGSSNNCPISSYKDKTDEEKTYEYWSGLSYQEQEDYFKSNEYLQRHINTHHYNDREQTAKHVAKLSKDYHKPFVDKYNRY